jgi:hypothetical protein
MFFIGTAWKKGWANMPPATLKRVKRQIKKFKKK